MFGLQLRAGRIASIDIFRALTVLVMITVNEWHRVGDLPAWMRHMPADADAMSFVDGVFPAFLFIVGMSIPFALQQRLQAGDTPRQLLLHVLQRGLGLVLIGVFMVNAEEGFHAASMPLPIALWALLSYLAAFALWGSLRGGPALAGGWRLAGVALFALLAWLYRGGPDGSGGMRTQWWGILGLIGWAYLLGCAALLLCRARVAGLLLALGLCLAYFALQRQPLVQGSGWLRLLFSQDGHAVHGALVISGSITALLFFDQGRARSLGVCRAWVADSGNRPQRGQFLPDLQPHSPAMGQEAGEKWTAAVDFPPAIPKSDRLLVQRLGLALLFAAALALLAALLRPAFKISKIYATPSWALYSAAACVLIFAALSLWLAWRQRVGAGAAAAPRRSGLLDAVAANPLLAYLTPFVVEALMQLLQWPWPAFTRSAPWGVVFGMAYAVAVAAFVKFIAARGVRLRI
ncbi:putative acyltransferase [Paucibacter oligotrophus]|uniref:Putative acyltransferase n=1 Tax=Roseateles oligotrophus TaxID=1769250 RepID=A0A840LEK5_9BURK|nr:DUF5009 domain-containing protein [Roseateles oligotrophus]MBB4844489.1 putative acyltransferase [Roseateles oligotrophus]